MALDLKFFVITIDHMGKKRGAPPKPDAKAKRELVQIRLSESEKAGFVLAADLDGKKLSEWIRDRLRRNAREELEGRHVDVPF